MLRDDEWLMVDLRCHRTDHPAVARGDTVIDIRCWQILLQQEEQGQQHRAQGPEEIREGQIRIVLLVYPLDHIEEIAAHEDVQRALEPAAVTEDNRQLLDVDRLAACHQLVEQFPLSRVQNILPHSL